jgi:hypothetical protein
MKEPMPFTDLERYLVNYYQTPAVSSWQRILAVEIGYLIASAGIIAFYLNGHDAGWGVVGYLILFFRLTAIAWSSRRWGPAFGGVVTKYEARIVELTAELEKRDRQLPHDSDDI